MHKHFVLLIACLVCAPIWALPSFGGNDETKRAEEIVAILREPTKLMTKAERLRVRNEREQAILTYQEAYQMLEKIEKEHDTQGKEWASLFFKKVQCESQIDTIRLEAASVEDRRQSVTDTSDLEAKLEAERNPKPIEPLPDAESVPADQPMTDPAAPTAPAEDDEGGFFLDEPEEEPEAKPEVTPEVKPAVKPEVKSEPVPEVKEESKPVVETAPEPVVAVKPEPVAETPVTKPETKPDVKSTETPVAVVEVQPAVKPAVTPEATPTPVPAKPEPKMVLADEIAWSNELLSMQKTEEAEKVVVAALSEFPDSSELMYALAQIRMVQQRPNEAVDLCKLIHIKDPKVGEAAAMLCAGAYVAQKQYIKAMDTLSAVLLVRPQQPAPYFNMAVILSRMEGGEETRKQAITYYRKSVALGGKRNAALEKTLDLVEE